MSPDHGSGFAPDFPLQPLAPGLYAFPQAPAGACAVYFLFKDGSLTGPLTFEQSWTTYGGLYLFCATPLALSGSPAFLDLARKRLFSSPVPQAWHAFVWLPAGDDLDAAQSLDFTGQQPVILTTPASVRLGDIGINFATAFNPVVALTQDAELGPGFSISVASANGVGLTFGTVTAKTHTIGSPALWTMILPVTGALAGSLTFAVGLDTGQLQACFGLGFVYGYGPDAAAESLFYPMAQPQVPSRSPLQFPDFRMMANPALPYAGAATRLEWTGNTPLPPFAFQSTTLAARSTPVPTPAKTVYAAPAPASGAWHSGGWGLHKAPGGTVFPGGAGVVSPPQRARTYLAPVGRWALGTSTPPTLASPPAPMDLMPGLALSEIVGIADGEPVFFVSGQPAYAPAYSPLASPASDGGATLLTDTFTAPWMEIVADAIDSPDRGYYSQPTASPFFAPLPGEPTLIALAVRAGRLTEPAPFPFVPYGGIGSALPGGGGACNPNVPAATFLGFESQVLSTARHDALATDPAGPALLPLMPTSPPVQPSQATTPVGLLIDLNTEGRWRKLTLARAPDAAAASPLGLAELSIAGAGSGGAPFPQDLAIALTQNELALVISRPGDDWDFRNKILVDGFEFRFDLGPADTILVFKFNTTVSLTDLVARPSLWAAGDTFNADTGAVSTALCAAIAEARADIGHSAESPFQAFIEMADDPAWTGIMAFNAAIDGSDMPPDLQMLLGGINGTLRAHHFGIQANQLAPLAGSGTGLRMDQSSLFAVIYYKDEGGTHPGSPAPDLAYRLELLSVIFSNSKVTQFNAKVGLVLNRLFGRPLALSSPVPSPPIDPNTLVIKGRYQNQNGVGQVLFRTAAPYLYAFQPPAPGASQILSQIHITGASLVPTGTVDAGSGGRQVKARFQIDGELWFAASPFPVPDPIDLFSYGASGSGGTGLPFTGLAIDMTFDLDANGATIPGSQTLTFEPSSLTPAPTAAAIRPNSLLAALPLRFSRFLAPKDTLTAARTGAQGVHVLQLETMAGDAESGSPAPTSPPMPAPAVSAQSPYGTTSASYALEYDITLGSLGKLSDLGVSLTAKLLLAWGPSPTIPENDAAAVLIQLPQLNAGAAGFSLEGILKTTFGDANLLKVDLGDDALTYAMMFSNVQLSIFGYTFPPGVLIDFLLFAGPPNGTAPTNSNNLAWFVSAQQQ